MRIEFFRRLRILNTIIAGLARSMSGAPTRSGLGMGTVYGPKCKAVSRREAA